MASLEFVTVNIRRYIHTWYYVLTSIIRVDRNQACLELLRLVTNCL